MKSVPAQLVCASECLYPNVFVCVCYCVSVRVTFNPSRRVHRNLSCKYPSLFHARIHPRRHIAMNVCKDFSTTSYMASCVIEFVAEQWNPISRRQRASEMTNF